MPGKARDLTLDRQDSSQGTGEFAQPASSYLDAFQESGAFPGRDVELWRCSPSSPSSSSNVVAFEVPTVEIPFHHFGVSTAVVMVAAMEGGK